MLADVFTVLLIEDNPGDARLIRQMLREGCGERCHIEVLDTPGELTPSVSASPSLRQLGRRRTPR